MHLFHFFSSFPLRYGKQEANRLRIFENLYFDSNGYGDYGESREGTIKALIIGVVRNLDAVSGGIQRMKMRKTGFEISILQTRVYGIQFKR